MADSKRQQIISAIKTGLQSITIANGYETDLGSSIYEWRLAEYQSMELPSAGNHERRSPIPSICISTT